MDIRKLYNISHPISSVKHITFILDSGGGFFSTFFFLCKAYIQSKKSKSLFYISHNRYPYMYKHGWHDYFTTLTCATPSILLSSTKCSHIRTPHWKHTVTEYINCLHEVFIISPELLLRVNDIVKTIGNYIGVFVRRGDKITETPFIPVDSILKCISYDKTTTFFIQTDDYTVIEEFKVILPNNKIISTVSPLKRGSYHNRFFKNKLNIRNLRSLDEKSLEEIKSETEEMLVGLMVCLSGRECWSDDTSNVGRFLKLYDPLKVKIYPKDYNLDLSKIIHPHHYIN